MTKGRDMISDLKFRTLSLFRRSSNGSNQSASAASSVHSGSEQQSHSPQHSPTHIRKRPSSARSRSSLIVPRLRHSTLEKSVQETEEPQSLPQSQAHSPESTSPSLQSEPQHHQPRLPELSDSATTAQAQLPSFKDTEQQLKNTQRLDHQHHEQQLNTHSPTRPKKQAVSSPLPLPTPEPSPLDQPGRTATLSAPRLNVQPSTPDGTESLQARGSSVAQIQTPETSTEHLATVKEEKEQERPRRSLQLDLGGRNRAVSAGKRSLLESRPRSPLHQSSTPDQGSSGNLSTGGGQVTGQADYQAPGQAQYRGRTSQDLEPNDYFSSVPNSPRYSRSPPAMAVSPSRYPQQYVQMQPQPRKRKIWVKRPNASATLVAIFEDDLVDDARDMILRKYANSLGKSFDSPDVTLRIHPREQAVSASQRSSTANETPSSLLNERCLRPDEVLCRTIDVYFPDGQSVEEALVIDTPAPAPHKSRRTPRHSPGVHSTHYGHFGAQYEDSRPTESDKEYFPPMMIAQPTINGQPSPRIAGAVPIVGPGGTHSIAVLNGAPLPALPSPRELGPGAGDLGKRRHGDHRRPKFGRTHTSSPTIVQHADPRQAIASANIPQLPALPTPPTTSVVPINRVSTPPPVRVSSPRPRAKRGKKPSISGSVSGLASPSTSTLLASVPPINVLVVEDNIINLKVLVAFLKRLKVRTHTAKDGREAVAKWREGGFHLVLMDIQLPLMNGLEATKEIRRLERVNGVGAFVKSAEAEKWDKASKRPEPSKEGSNETVTDEKSEEQRNRIGKRELFKSPVIIVALTASSLHSDRSEALAAGCNDFLTKPVNYTWLERKLKEWGCMQALIDFDGWRQWKDFQSPPTLITASPKVLQEVQKKNGLTVAPSTPSKLSQTDSSEIDGPWSVGVGSASKKRLPSRSSSTLKDLSSKVESNESTTTLDSMTSDDGDSFDTAIPTRSESRTVSHRSSLSPTGPSFNIQAPTPSRKANSPPRLGDAPLSPKRRSPTNSVGAASPRMGAHATAANADEDREQWGSIETPSRRRRTNAGHERVLSAVGEEVEIMPSSPRKSDGVEVGA